MSNPQSLIIIKPRCVDPAAEDKVTAYCFGDLKEHDLEAVESHMLDCDRCWHEIHRLEAAVRKLDTDKSLLNLLTPMEVASAFGISGKLERLFGGHWMFVLVAGLIYAVLFGEALLVEVAYQYDRYAGSAPYVAIGASLWILVTTLAALALDWRLTTGGRSSGLKASIAIIVAAALLLFGAICFYLPTSPITELSFQAYPAQAAYLKTIGYIVVLGMIFFFPPYHFILAMQRELLLGHYQLTSDLLRGEALSVSPKGSIYPRFWVMPLVFAVIIGLSLMLHHNLMSNLKPGVNQGLFSNLILIRLILMYLLAGVGLLWYYMSLNELKRECLAAARISVMKK